MTEKEIAAVIGKDRVLAGHPVVCANVNHLLKGQQDVLSVNKAGFLTEYEIKVSRGDFFKDAKKGKEMAFKGVAAWPDYVPNQFYYVVPAGLVMIPEVPEWAGLIWVDTSLDSSQRVLIQKKKAPVIHKHKVDPIKVFKKIATIYSERQFLGCCKLTYKNKKARAENERILKQYGLL